MRLLFVGGCERSGTTLVQRLLCAHRRIAGGPEFLYTWRVAELFDRMRAQIPEEYARRRQAFYDQAALARSFRRLLAGFFEPLMKSKPGALYFSEKTPSNIYAAATLLELFPEARFVHVLRDGRDVLASHRAVAERLRGRGRGESGSLRPRAVCARWNGAVGAHFELAADTGVGDRYHLVRFERLIAEPRRVLGELCAFLDLELEPAMLEPENAPPEASGLVVDDLWVTGDGVGRGFDSSSVERWRRDLPAGTRLLSALLMGHELARAGYPVGRGTAVAARALRRLRPQRRTAPSQNPAQARSRARRVAPPVRPGARRT